MIIVLNWQNLFVSLRWQHSIQDISYVRPSWRYVVSILPSENEATPLVNLPLTSQNKIDAIWIFKFLHSLWLIYIFLSCFILFMTKIYLWPILWASVFACELWWQLIFAVDVMWQLTYSQQLFSLEAGWSWMTSHHTSKFSRRLFLLARDAAGRPVQFCRILFSQSHVPLLRYCETIEMLVPVPLVPCPAFR